MSFLDDLKNYLSGQNPDKVKQALANTPLANSADMFTSPSSSDFDVNASDTPLTQNGAMPQPAPTQVATAGPNDTFVPGPNGGTTAPAPQKPSLADELSQKNPVKAKSIGPKSSTPPELPDSDDEDAPDENLSNKDIVQGLTTSTDDAKRQAMLDELEKRKKLNILPMALSQAADAIAGSASAFGANVSQGNAKAEGEREDKEAEDAKQEFEQSLRTDPNSDISKQYQSLLGKFLQKDPSDPMIAGRSASQIAEQIPAIEKLANMQNQKDMKELQLKQIQSNKELALAQMNSNKQGEYEKQGRDILLKQLSNRSGGLGLQDSKVNQAIDLQQMLNKFYDPKTDTYTIPPSMHTELAIGLQRLLSPTGTTAEGLVNDLRQKTAKEGLAGGLIYLGMDPAKVGGTTNSVAHLFADTVKRQGLTAEQLRNTYQGQLKNMLPTQLNDNVKQQLIKESLGSNYSDFLPKNASQTQSIQTSAPVTKQIGGKTYIQQNGKWYQQ